MPTLTLIVDNSADKQRNRRLPESKAIEDRRENAGSVELGNHMGDLRVCCGRDKARIERHDCYRALEVCTAQRNRERRQVLQSVGGVKTRTDAVNTIEGPSSL